MKSVAALFQSLWKRAAFSRQSKLFLLALLLPLVPATPLRSQSEPFRIDRIPSELGLSQNLISTLLQDHKGFLWVGTKDGLNRFDGYKFTVYQYDAFDSTSLSDNFITALYEDREGRLWVGTQKGLNLFDRAAETFHRSLPDPTNPNSLSHAFVSGIAGDSRESGRSGIWVATYGGGLNRIVLPAGAGNFEGATYTHFRRDSSSVMAEKSLSSDILEDPQVDGQGALWAINGRSIYKLIRGQTGYVVRRFDPNPPDPVWKKMLEDRSNFDPYLLAPGANGRIWIWADVGLIRWEAETEELSYYNLRHENPPDFSWTLYEDAAGVVWIGFDGGLGRFVPRTGRYDFYKHEPGNPNSLPASGINAILEDAGGVLWLGSNGHGLFRYDPKAEPFTKIKALENSKLALWRGSSLRAICETRDGALWLGTACGASTAARVCSSPIAMIRMIASA